MAWPCFHTSQLAAMVTSAPEWNSRMALIVVGVVTLIFLPRIGPSAVTSRWVKPAVAIAATVFTGPSRLTSVVT